MKYMNIRILRGVSEAEKSTGLTVVIDVFRAFSTACYFFGNGATTVIPINNAEVAYFLKKSNPDFLSSGERQGYKLKNFDFGNSPSEIVNKDFTNKTILLTTTLGTQGLMRVKGASEIITGSFVNLGAIVRYIIQKEPAIVTLLCTNDQSGKAEDEDYLCACLIADKLQNNRMSFKKIISKIMHNGSANHFFDPKITSHPEKDFHLCTALDKFQFVLKANEYQINLKQLTKYSI